MNGPNDFQEAPLGPLSLLLCCLGFAGCQPATDAPTALRLVDLFGHATVSGAPVPEPAHQAPTWSFEAGGTAGFQAGAGIAGLGAEDGLLVGRTTTSSSVLHVERSEGLDEVDLLHAAEIRLRVSAGSELSIHFDGAEELNLERALASPFPWTLSSPIVPGEEFRTYTLAAQQAVPASRVRHLLLRPTDESGADFAIESVRLIFRKEHLRSIPSGVGWHGMSNIYREAIVSRSPEEIRFDLTLPPAATLELNLAVIEAGAASFSVEIEPQGSSKPPLRLRRTVTTPQAWHPANLDLGPLGAGPVTVALRVSAERDGFLGFWGAPVIRRRGASGDDQPQGVIVIVGDTLRRDHLGLYGYERPTAPVLARLASEGALAKDCISQATWTKVSVPSIFTSLYPSSHGVREFADRLPASARTLAEVFRDRGYATLALTSIPFTGQATNLHQGYETLHEASSLERSSDAKTAREYVDRLLPWLEAHRDVPFFVFLHVADPHSPYVPYEPYDTTWAEAGDKEAYRKAVEKVRPHIKEPLMRRFGMPTRDDLNEAGVDPEAYVALERDAYDGSIRGMDVELGRLLERLEELGLRDRTLLAFVSDHGTELLDHDQHFHGHSVYGELNQVPLLFWGPGYVPAAVVVEETVQTLDLMPTLLDLAGMEIPDGVQGQSLAPLIRRRGAGSGDATVAGWRARPAITEKARTDDPLPGRDYESTSIIVDGWKLIHNHPTPELVPEHELFDHRADPLSLRNLAEEHPEKVEELFAQLESWRRFALDNRLASDDELADSLSAEELERLRSLGYL